MTNTTILVLALLGGCAGSVEGFSNDSNTVDAGTPRGTADAGAVPGDGASPADAAMPVVVPADGAAPADAALDVDDLSRCAPDAQVVMQRSQLSRYGVAYTDADASIENYPVSQFKPNFGVPGFDAPLKDNVLAIRVRVPATYVSAHPDHLGFIRVAEAPGQQVTAHALCISSHACDFTPCPYVGDTSPGITFEVDGPAMPSIPSFHVGQVIWINIAHRTAQGTPSCPDASCGILVDFASPNRY